MIEEKQAAQAKIGKLARLRTLLARDPEALACPDCGAALLLAPNGYEALARESPVLRCARGHCYDLAKKGYANLLGCGGGAKGIYDRAFFESRRAVFGFGFFAEAARRIAALAKELLRPAETGRRVLDAGCGEGYFSFALSRDASLRAGCRFYGLDLSRDAVTTAAGYEADIAWIVGDIAKPPFRDGAFELVLNVLSPAAYGAFRRILTPDGFMIKVLPGPEHLRELRALRRADARTRKDGGEAAAHCEKHMRVVERAKLRYLCEPEAEQKKFLPAMTPLTAGKVIDHAALESLRRVTIDLEIIAGRPL